MHFVHVPFTDRYNVHDCVMWYTYGKLIHVHVHVEDIIYMYVSAVLYMYIHMYKMYTYTMYMYLTFQNMMERFVPTRLSSCVFTKKYCIYCAWYMYNYKCM